MSDRTELPPNWRPDYTLQDIIPACADWRSFRKISHAPRYAASVTGAGIFDLKRRAFVSPRIDKRTGRKRYRLNASDPDAGKLVAVKTYFYSRIICAMVEGAAPNRKTEAHHINSNRVDDHWINLSWSTRTANRRMAKEARSRVGDCNPNAKLSNARLAELLEHHDDLWRRNKRIDLNQYAAWFGISAKQVWRLVNERSRAPEVRGIRDAQRAERERQARLKRLMQQS